MLKKGSPEQLNIVSVVGGAGYIGLSIVKKLLDQDYFVRVIDRFMHPSPEIMRLEEQYANIQIIKTDICDTRAISRALVGSESVILLASVQGSRFRDSAGEHIRDVNFLASTVVLDAAIEHGVSRFMFASTDSVYGNLTGVIYETTVPEPISFYSRLKLRMEQRVLQSKRRTFHPTVFRIGTCYGASPAIRFDLVANRFAMDSAKKNQITVNGGEQWRALVHVDDVAEGFLASLRAHDSIISGQVFNLSNGIENLTINQVANIFKKINPELQVDVIEKEPDLVDFRLSTSKIEKLLDFRAKNTLESSMTLLHRKIVDGEYDDIIQYTLSNEQKRLQNIDDMLLQIG